jgi:hypothetical protein
MKSISMAPAASAKAAGVLRRETDGHGRGNAILTHLAHHVCDVRLPIAHADIDRQAKCAGEQVPLLQGELSQRARANKTVTVTNFFHHRCRHGTPTGDIAQVLGNLIERLGCSVSEQQNGAPFGFERDLRHGNRLQSGR